MRPTGKITRAQYEAMSRAERVNYQKNRLKRRKRQRDRLIFGIVMIFICAVGVALSFTVFFKVATVEVDGNGRYGAEEVIEKSGIELESNMFLINRKKTAALLERELPYIGQATVKLGLPDKIVIELEEVRAAFAVRESEGYVLLDDNCKVLEKKVLSYPENLALLEGVDTSEFQAGDYLMNAQGEDVDGKGELVSTDADDDEFLDEDTEEQDMALVLRNLLKVVGVVRDVEFRDITRLDFTDVNNIKLIYQDRLTLLIGTASNLEQKLRLGKKTIEDEDKMRPFRTGVVDLTRGNKVYVRSEEYTSISSQEEAESAAESGVN